MNEAKLFSHFPEIQSDELVLSKITALDLNDMYDLCSNETLYKYSSSSAKKNKAVVYNMITQFDRDFNHKKAIYWGIYQKNAHQKMIGLIELFDFNKSVDMVTIGYMLNESYWGKGYATRAVHLALDFLFCTADINRVQALIVSENIKSKRVLLRNRFTYEGTVRQGMYWDGIGIVNIDIFSILKKEYVV
ncbi:MAG: GNAT family N-acetyltransferase [bacterium]|nr:GNAT family N-acetyltransferase [bacterium]